MQRTKRANASERAGGLSGASPEFIRGHKRAKKLGNDEDHEGR